MKNQQGDSISAAKWKITFFCNHNCATLCTIAPCFGVVFLQIQAQHHLSLTRSQAQCHHVGKGSVGWEQMSIGSRSVRFPPRTWIVRRMRSQNHIPNAMQSHEFRWGHQPYATYGTTVLWALWLCLLLSSYRGLLSEKCHKSCAGGHPDHLSYPSSTSTQTRGPGRSGELETLGFQKVLVSKKHIFSTKLSSQ